MIRQMRDQQDLKTSRLNDPASARNVDNASDRRDPPGDARNVDDKANRRDVK